MCRRAYHPVWFVLCLLCCATLPMLLTLIECATRFTLCCVPTVFNMSVFHVCVCLCVGPEVVVGKGQRPVETQNGDMVTHGNNW
jgi:hypothetical protein